MVMGAASAVGYSASDRAVKGVAAGREKDELKNRMALSCDIKNAFNGDVYPFVENALKNAYNVEIFQRMALQSGISTRLNPLRRGVYKADKSWTGGDGEQGAVYTLNGADTNEVFKREIRLSNLDAIVRDCSQQMWMQAGYCAALVCIGDRLGTEPRRFVTRLFLPERFNAIPYPGSPGILWKVQLFSHDASGQYPFHRIDWTEKDWSEWQRKDEGEEWKQVDGGVNLYGCIPAVIARPNPFCLWADSFGPQLFESTIRINCAQTLLEYNAPMQAKVLMGSFQKMPAVQVVQHAALIDDGGAGASQLHDLSTDQKMFREVHIDGEWRFAAQLLGFPADEFDGTAVPQSGEALKIRLYTAMQQATARQTWLIEFARQLYWTRLQVLATEMQFPAPIIGYEDGKLPPYKQGLSIEQQPVRFDVQPKPITLPQMAREVADQEDRDEEKGFRNRVEIMQAKFPHMTTEEAAMALRDNMRINAALEAAAEPMDAADPQDGAQGAPSPKAEPADAPASQGQDAPATDASGKVQAGTAAAATLNGAQITAALEVVQLYASGKIAYITAVELLVAVGIERSQAEKMATAEDKRPKPAPDAAPQPPAQPFGGPPQPPSSSA